MERDGNQAMVKKGVCMGCAYGVLVPVPSSDHLPNKSSQ